MVLETIALIIGGLFLVWIAFYVIAVYNGLIRLRNNIKKSWSNINVLLKQRNSELPKLVASVKGYMKHERGVLTTVTKARTAMMRAKTKPQKAAADNMLSGALKTLFAVAESYPKLRANENFMHLQGRISGLENELTDRREFYNDGVNIYNIRVQSFPDMIFAGMLGFKEETLFRVTPAEMRDVKIKF